MASQPAGVTGEYPEQPAVRTESSFAARAEVSLHALSHAGKVRTSNEDAFLVARIERAFTTLMTNLPAGHVPDEFQDVSYGMVVADGMGGMAGGDVASRLAL